MRITLLDLEARAHEISRIVDHAVVCGGDCLPSSADSCCNASITAPFVELAAFDPLEDAPYEFLQFVALLDRVSSFQRSAWRFLADEHGIYVDRDFLMEHFDL
jgi:hypothetical protein